ncbi:unnamed protein product [Chrysodeixis includens]|uniref:G-patch domain-containing protein n=1 Tax=Chrysodeixis includens TaxID=689277 RepID=A0A9P0BQ75_CHRIL|nr:unnamed protein product [Chrysodeixis includens]
MNNKKYSNFVKASSPTPSHEGEQIYRKVLSGEEAQKLYLEEVSAAKASISGRTRSACDVEITRTIVIEEDSDLSNKDLFITVQDNDVNKLKRALDKCPDRVHVLDEFGWSLLMIACQANSVDVVKLLLKKGVDVNIRDKAGNSARSLVIKNKNYVLADVLINYKHKEKPRQTTDSKIKVKSKEKIQCETCGNLYLDREEHLSSTIHNINASKGKKIPASYVIPINNVGYQLMLKNGWDKNTGLGKDGSGKLYPIKTVQKKDRKGIGHEKRKHEEKMEEDKHKNRKKMARERHNNKSFEINFRRQFY